MTLFLTSVSPPALHILALISLPIAAACASESAAPTQPGPANPITQSAVGSASNPQGGTSTLGGGGATAASNVAGANAGGLSETAGGNMAGAANVPSAGGSSAGGGSAGVGGETMASPASGTGGTSQGGLPAVDMGPVKHHVMAIEYPGRLVEISAEGTKLWEHQTPSLTVMFNVLPNGNIFYPHGGKTPGAQEIDKERKVVWEYKSSAGELLGGDVLANGNRLLGEGGPAVALELDSDQQVVRTIPIMTTETKSHTQVRHVHRLDNGNVLLALEGEGVAREIDADGATVWEHKGVKTIHEAIRLPSGNTLMSGAKKLLEVDATGAVVWEFGEADAPELGLKSVTSIQPLKNGNFLVGNWLGASGGNGVHAFEVTRGKEVVWTLDDHELLKSATTVTALDD